MAGVLLIKITQHPELRTQLLETGDQFLIEDVSRRQSESGLFWGAARQAEEVPGAWQADDGSWWVGRNELGRCWGLIRNVERTMIKNT